jgi:hypothetical protein
MTTLCSAFDDFGLGFGTAGVGVSAEADVLEESLRQSVSHYLEPRLSLLVPELMSLADGSEGESTSADSETIKAAIRFAYCLPRFAPLPEVSVDPDGEISFDWLSPLGEMFSVSVNKQNRLAYAGWFGEKSRIHGIEQLAENCPQEIIRGIQKATLSEQQSERRSRQPITKALHGSN